MNVASWNLSWLVRAAWSGEGPYYYADPSAEGVSMNDKIYSRYLRPDGRTYAYVHKADPVDSTTWEYIYPAEGKDAKEENVEYEANTTNTHSIFVADVKGSRSITLWQTPSIRIKMGAEKNFVITFPGGIIGDSFNSADVRDKINAGAGATVCDLNPDGYCRIRSQWGPITVINENTTLSHDNPVAMFLKSTVPPGEGQSYTEDVNAFQIAGDAVVNIKIDDVADQNVSFTQASPDGDGYWTLDEIVTTIGDEVGSQYVSRLGDGFLVFGASNVQGTALVEITDVSGNGVEEIFAGSGGAIVRNSIQRYNRYKQSWRTDYYLIAWDDTHRYVPGNMTAGNASSSGCFTFKELISESEPMRACASQEEAMFRNLQWVLTEKKLVLIVPFFLNALDMDRIAMFQIVEGNGFEGLVNARKFRENRVWAKKGTTGDSKIPGDYRLNILCSPGGLLLSEGGVYDDSLGHGSANPAVIPHTFTALSRLGFPRSARGDVAAGNPDYGNTVSFHNFILGSKEFEADGEDANWKNRNGLIPLILALLGSAWELSDADHHGIADIVDMRFATLRPLFFYNRRGGPGPCRHSWVHRIQGGTNLYDYLKSDAEDGVGLVTDVNNTTGWFGGWTARNYYQPAGLPTGMSFIIDSDPSLNRSDTNRRMDGLVPALTAYDITRDRGDDNPTNTRAVTKLLNLLSKLSDPAFDDPGAIDDGDLATYGTRRKVLYGLEQMMTIQRMKKGIATVINETNFKAQIFPAWMFTAGVDGDGDGIYDDVRPEDIIVDEGLDISIGSDALGIGLAVYPDEREPGHPSGKTWYFFNDAADKAVEFTSDLGEGAGKFNVTENLISLLDRIFTKVSPSQEEIHGLVHTLGILNTEYDSGAGEWTYPDDLAEIETLFMPTMMDLGKANGLMSAEFNYALMVNGGLIEYVIHTMETPYSAGEIFSDLYRLLGHEQIANNDSLLWRDLVAMNEGLIESILNRISSLDFTEMNDFQYNGPYGDSLFSGWDPFGDLGMVFSSP